MRASTVTALIAGVGLGYGSMRAVSSSDTLQRNEGSRSALLSRDDVTPLGSPLDELTIPRDSGAKDAVAAPHPFCAENERLRDMLSEIGENRAKIEDRYRVVEDTRYDLLGEHRTSLTEDGEMLRVVRGEAAEIEARLLLRLEILKGRQKELNERHTRLLERREDLSEDYDKALKEHTRLTERLAQERAKIDSFIAGRPERERALQEAWGREIDAMRAHVAMCDLCPHHVD